MGKPIRSSNAGLNTDALPESRRFGGGGEEGCPAYLRGRHMNGTPCEELPAEVWAYLPADRTDEALDTAVRNAGGARVGRGETEGRMAERRDGLAAGMQPWEAPDVLKEAASILPVGMRPKFISEGRANRGEVASRGFKVVKDDCGDPIRVGDLVLAAMPEDQAQARNLHYRKMARQVETTSDVERAKGGSQYARKGAEFSENGSGGRTLGESVLDDSPAVAGNIDSDTGRYEA